MTDDLVKLDENPYGTGLGVKDLVVSKLVVKKISAKAE